MKTLKITIEVKDGKEDSKEFIIKHSDELTPTEAIEFAKTIILNEI